MKSFDLRKRREILLGDATGFSTIRYCLEMDEDEAVEKYALPGSIDMMVCTVLDGLLVSLDAEVEPILGRARKWQALAIELGHVHPDPGQRGLFFENVVLAEWLATNGDDRQAIESTMDGLEGYLSKSVAAHGKYDSVGMDGYMRFATSAGQYHRANGFVESLEPKLKRPSGWIGKSRSQRGLAYEICRLQTAGGADAAKLEPVLQKFLTRNMLNWYANGWGQDATKWLKYAFWRREPGHWSPAQTVRKALDYMPTVNRGE